MPVVGSRTLAERAHDLLAHPCVVLERERIAQRRRGTAQSTERPCGVTTDEQIAIAEGAPERGNAARVARVAERHAHVA